MGFPGSLVSPLLSFTKPNMHWSALTFSANGSALNLAIALKFHEVGSQGIHAASIDVIATQKPTFL